MPKRFRRYEKWTKKLQSIAIYFAWNWVKIMKIIFKWDFSNRPKNFDIHAILMWYNNVLITLRRWYLFAACFPATHHPGKFGWKWRKAASEWTQTSLWKENLSIIIDLCAFEVLCIWCRYICIDEIAKI